MRWHLIPTAYAVTALGAGCYLSHEREGGSLRDAGSAHPDAAAADAASIDAGALDAALLDASIGDAERDAGSTTPCVVMCDPPDVAGTWMAPSDSNPFSLLGIALTGGRIGVLVELMIPGADSAAEYRLVLFDGTGATAIATETDVLRTVGEVAVAGLVVRDEGFRIAGITNSTLRCTRTLGVGLAAWSAEGALSSSAHVEGFANFPGCDPVRYGGGVTWRGDSVSTSMIIDGTITVGTTDGDSLRVETGPTVSEVARGPARATIIAYSDDLVLVAGGGRARTLGALPGFVAVGPSVETSTLFPLEGTSTDPPPVLAVTPSAPRIARFVVDPREIDRSALHAWNVGATGVGSEQLRVESPGGFAPISLTFASEADALVWTSPDPIRIGEADLHVAFLSAPDEPICMAPSSPITAHLPVPLLGDNLVAAGSRDNLYVAFLELASPARLVLLRLGDCHGAP